MRWDLHQAESLHCWKPFPVFPKTSDLIWGFPVATLLQQSPKKLTSQIPQDLATHHWPDPSSGSSHPTYFCIATFVLFSDSSLTLVGCRLTYPGPNPWLLPDYVAALIPAQVFTFVTNTTHSQLTAPY